MIQIILIVGFLFLYIAIDLGFEKLTQTLRQELENIAITIREKQNE